MPSQSDGETRSQVIDRSKADGVQQPGTPWEERIKRLIGPKILVLRCARDHVRDKKGDILVALPDTYLDAAKHLDWFEIVQVSQDCQTFTLDNVGDLIHGPIYADGMHRLWDYERMAPSDFFVLHEKLIGEGKTCHIKPFVLTRRTL